MQMRVGRRAKPRRTFIYGPPGTGKSTFAAHSRKPIFITTEEGVNDMDVHAFPPEETGHDKCESVDEVMYYLQWLRTEPHDRETVVIDSVDWFEKLVHAQVALDRKVPTIGDIGYGKAPAFCLPYWERFREALEALRRDRKMAVILIGHSQIEKANKPDLEQYDCYSPRLDKLASAILQEWSDDVLFVNFKTYTKQVDVGFNKTKSQGIGTGERVIKTTERPSHKAKNHLGLPDELPMNFPDPFAAYAEYLPPVQ